MCSWKACDRFIGLQHNVTTTPKVLVIRTLMLLLVLGLSVGGAYVYWMFPVMRTWWMVGTFFLLNSELVVQALPWLTIGALTPQPDLTALAGHPTALRILHVSTHLAFCACCVAVGEQVYANSLDDDINWVMLGAVAVAWYKGFQQYQVTAAQVILTGLVWWVRADLRPGASGHVELAAAVPTKLPPARPRPITLDAAHAADIELGLAGRRRRSDSDLQRLCTEYNKMHRPNWVLTPS